MTYLSCFSQNMTFNKVEDVMVKCQLFPCVTLGEKHIKSNTLPYKSSTSLKFTCNMFIHPTWHYYQVNEASKMSRDSDEHQKCLRMRADRFI